MKEWILLVIACIFAAAYNVALMIAHMSSADGEFETVAALLTILNTVKDTAVLAAILFNIFL